MELIKKGELPENKPVTFSCDYCKCVMRASKNEGKETSGRDGDFVTFKCMTCKRDVHVDSSKFRVRMPAV